MRITQIDIPKDFKDNGIERIQMNRLGPVVLLAGKNGSGKSRILSKIEQSIKIKPADEKLTQNINQIKSYETAIKEYTARINNLNKQEQTAETVRQIKSLQDNISEWKVNLKNSQEIVNYSQIITDPEFGTYNIVPFVPSDAKLVDCNTYSKNDLLTHANNLDKLGMRLVDQSTLAKIQAVQDSYFNVTHPDFKFNEGDKAKAIADYNKLKELISLFLFTELTRSANGEAMIFNFPIGKANLSHGQSILLKFCLAIFSQGNKLSDMILFLDEPENHLHPSMLIETLDRVVKAVPNGQVWISTHSISVLAHFDPGLIWYVDNNTVSYAGNIPEKVLKSLLGGDDEIAKLQDFINLPSQYAINRHAFECLFTPISVSTDKSDPQTIQINSELGLILKSGKIKMLDYGAGKGRLLSNITETVDDNITDFANNFEYIAFDKYSYDKEQCIKVIHEVYGSADHKYFNDTTSLLSDHDSNTFDVIIMCNVFHEIDPKDWLSIFSSTGLMSKLLKDTGIVLIVEDMQMPVGEKAYQKGFIVLDTPQLKELFNITSKDKDLGFGVADARGDGRLKAHRIPKACLNRISSQSRIASLKSLQSISQEKILDIRTKEINYKNGKIHAFWVQQFANTSLALSELSAN